MKIILRIVSAITFTAVLLTVIIIFNYYQASGFTYLLKDIGLAVPTLAGWLLTLLLGPYAAVQLWRLKNSGRVATSILVAWAIFYYVYGFAFYRSIGENFTQLVPVIAVNLLMLAVLQLPAAKQACLRSES